MDIPAKLGPENESLASFTAKERKAPVINWYRSPIPKEEFKRLHEKSDLKGWIQTGGFLAILFGLAGLAIYSFNAWPWWATVLCVFAYGTVQSFTINAMHELIHGTVFKTKSLNRFFAGVVSFLSWINHEMFQASHARHHRYTLHPPDDLEVVLPFKLMIRHLFTTGIVHFHKFWRTSVRLAGGKFQGEWELTLFPPDDLESRKPAIRWARFLLIGHGLILIVGIVTGQWILPILFTLANLYGGWLFWLCNNTQHIGLKDYVPDFRLCCRTFTLSPFVQFLYWHMNFHTEHHMYAAVPCYNLPRLHRLIRDDLPPTHHGLVPVWCEIFGILKKQETDPSYQHELELPKHSPARG